MTSYNFALTSLELLQHAFLKFRPTARPDFKTPPMNMSTNSLSRCPRVGFTLIELLVTMGILVILVAILIPVVQSVRKSAQLTNSISNLRQIAIAQSLFAPEHRGYIAMPFNIVHQRSGQPAGVTWQRRLAPYVSDQLRGTMGGMGTIWESPAVGIGEMHGSSHTTYGLNTRLAIDGNPSWGTWTGLLMELEHPAKFVIIAPRPPGNSDYFFVHELPWDRYRSGFLPMLKADMSVQNYSRTDQIMADGDLNSSNRRAAPSIFQPFN